MGAGLGGVISTITTPFTLQKQVNGIQKWADLKNRFDKELDYQKEYKEAKRLTDRARHHWLTSHRPGFDKEIWREECMGTDAYFEYQKYLNNNTGAYAKLNKDQANKTSDFSNKIYKSIRNINNAKSKILNGKR